VSADSAESIVKFWKILDAIWWEQFLPVCRLGQLWYGIQG